MRKKAAPKTGEGLFGVKPDVRFRIVELDLCGAEHLRQAAETIVAAFKEAVPRLTLESAVDEVQEMRTRLALAAIDQRNRLVGVIGSIPAHGGGAWEIHPLAVHPNVWRGGIGRALVHALEARAAIQGVTTMFVRAQDRHGKTSLSNVDLYAALPACLDRVSFTGPHPAAFFLRCGYRIVGAIPDASGPGHPDIFLAKRLN
ncbi:MAG TPA: GNAT family N-acetyltransferase [Fimbriimonadaceae bacterium]|nr:GNAT family N-acetyltransferase [Fimbriimonadaceae bacterium]